MKKLFCDIDNTLNNHWERIRRNTTDGWCDFDKAFTYEEHQKDVVLPGSLEAVKELDKHYEIHMLTARWYDNAYEWTKEWLDRFGFPYKSIITCDNTMDKVGIIKDEDCFLVDDLSKKHQVEPPYKVLYWDVIQKLNENNIDYEIFKDNWNEILMRRIPKNG